MIQMLGKKKTRDYDRDFWEGSCCIVSPARPFLEKVILTPRNKKFKNTSCSEVREGHFWQKPALRDKRFWNVQYSEKVTFNWIGEGDFQLDWRR